MLEFRKWALVAFALAVVGVCAAPARPAQKDRAGKKEKLVAEEGAIKVILLRHKSVRDDLKLSDKQAGKVRDFAARQWKKAQGVADLEDKEKREARWKAMGKENDNFLRETLSKEQYRRLEQIGMQVAGLAWVTRPDIARELKLTDDQKKKYRDLQKTAHKEMHDILHGDRIKDPDDKLRELGKTNRKRLWDLLTDDQQATWKRLRGEPFKGDLSKD